MPTACAIVIFGASGDLAKRKLLPAIYELAREKLLSENFALVGFGRSEMSDEQYRQECREAVKQFARTKPVDEEIWNRIEAGICYVQGNYDSKEDHDRLIAKLAELDNSRKTGGNRLFYLSTPPVLFEPIIECLGR
ncbi:MAG TPA: hypothetical protein VG722_09055, partial [Tepidisphaeraceae bacterium]|nr:hypothetical protein [Tepidisphaeraceae bacterium]